MIDKAILKKHNLKAVPFSAIGEGQTFMCESSLHRSREHGPCFYTRIVLDVRICYRDIPSWVLYDSREEYAGMTVYVPVWRVC